MSVQAPAAPPAATAAPAARLDHSLLRGIAWTAGVKWGTQVLTWVSTIVVARLLTPADYGVVGMAAVFLGLITLLGEFGLGAAVVTLRELDERQVRQLNTLSVLLGVAGFGAACAAALPLARFFDAPRLAWVVVALGTGFVVAGFRTVPESLLQRDLRFRALALVEGAQAALVAGATVGMAMAGLGYWTLVGGTLLAGAAQTAAAVALRPQGFALPTRAGLAPALRMSWHVLVGRLSWYVYANADFMIVGRVLGERALGFYSFAWSLASIPIGKVSGLILRVTPAHFAAVQDDRPALRRWFLTLTEGLALATFPATVGLALVAEPFVLAVLGEKWRAAVPVLRLLALYASLRSITPLLPQVLTVTRDTRYAMWTSVAGAVVLPAAFLIGSRWGITGVAVAWMIAHPLCILPLYLRVFRRLELRAAEYLRAVAPALGGCVVMAAAVAGAGALTRGWPPGAALAASVAAGAAGYGGWIAAAHRDRLRAFLATIRAARQA